MAFSTTVRLMSSTVFLAYDMKSSKDAIYPPVEHQDTLEEGENQRRRDRLGKVFHKPPQLLLSTDPFDPHILVRKCHLQGKQANRLIN